MNSKSYRYHLTALLLMISFLGCSGSNHKNDKNIDAALTWKLSDIRKKMPDGFVMLGDPQLVSSSVGNAVHFNGRNDAFLYNRNPLNGLQQFTIEVIMKPDSAGPFAQRFFHLGTSRGHRVLMEIRNTGTQWYLDAFLNSVTNLTLADSSKTHPTGKWYDVAFVVDNGKMDTYVNGKHELSRRVKFEPFTGGKASLGVRMNREYWYKGDIDEVRITSRKLSPSEFLKY